MSEEGSPNAMNVVVYPTRPDHKVHAQAPDGYPACLWNNKRGENARSAGRRYVETSAPVTCLRYACGGH
jgi:hypothetical protein